MRRNGEKMPVREKPLLERAEAGELTEDENMTFWCGFNSGKAGELLSEGAFGWGSHTELYLKAWKMGMEWQRIASQT